MLLRKQVKEYAQWIGWGQGCFLVGYLLQAATTDRVPMHWFHGLMNNAPAFDMLQGFAAGLSGVLMGLSIVLNVRGLMAYRVERQRRTG